VSGYNVILRYGNGGGTKGFTLNSSGNVTIGASDLASNTTKLYVDGGIRFAPRTIWGQSFDGTGNISESFTMKDKLLIYPGTNLFVFGNETTDTYLRGDNIRLQYGSSVTQGLILNSSGNVGIGTTDPKYKLDVNGKIRFEERTIWGQSFDGTGDVSGVLSDVNQISFDASKSYGIFRGDWIHSNLQREDLSFYAPKHFF
jgi:hypothetical protein